MEFSVIDYEKIINALDHAIDVFQYMHGHDNLFIYMNSLTTYVVLAVITDGKSYDVMYNTSFNSDGQPIYMGYRIIETNDLKVGEIRISEK